MPVTKSPLRYPGGKTQLSKFLENLIDINDLDNTTYCEPFSGGFGAGLELLFNQSVEKIIINDLDIGIYSIWHAILYDEKKLIYFIEKTPITIKEWRKQKEIYDNMKYSTEYSIELAFSTFFLNRTNRSGIIGAGPIGGQNQESKYKIDCRFNKENLIEKIISINNKKKDIYLYNKEANDLIESVLSKYSPEELFVFFDPPYYKQGKNLYKNYFTHENHIELKKKISLMDKYKWITTYDYNENIKEIYSEYYSNEYSIQYSANKVRKEKELLFNSPITKVESFDKVIFN